MTPAHTTPALPWIGTLVTAVVDGHTITGEVMPYQRYRHAQDTFPVAFGQRWRTMTPATITQLPDQPPGRREPDRVGECASAGAPLLDDPPHVPDRPQFGENFVPKQRRDRLAPAMSGTLA